MSLQSNERYGLSHAIARTYVYKLKVNAGLFSALILAQVVAGVMSLNGSSTSSMQLFSINSASSVNVHTYAATVYMLFSIAWAVVLAVALTMRARSNVTFTMVANRLSDCITDIAVIITGCVFGGIITALFSIAMRVPIYLIAGGRVASANFIPNTSEILILIASTALYMLLFASAFYLAGALIKLSRAFYIIMPVVGFGIMSLAQSALAYAYINEGNVKVRVNIFAQCFYFYFQEKSLLFFTIKTVIFAAIMFISSTIIFNRLEVRK